MLFCLPDTVLSVMYFLSQKFLLLLLILESYAADSKSRFPEEHQNFAGLGYVE